MANETTATVVGSLGHGTRTLDVFHTTYAGRQVPIIDQFCATYEIAGGVGIATGQISLLGAAVAMGAYSEAGAAPSNTALPALGTPVTLTPAGYALCMAPTSEAFNRVDAGLISLEDLLLGEMEAAARTLIAYDTTIGVAYARMAGFSNRVGTPGATMTPQTLVDAYYQLCTQVGHADVQAVAVISLKQWTELIKYGLETAASSWGGATFNEMFADLLKAVNGTISGYRMSLGPIHIFVEPNPTAFQTVSSNTIAGLFIPAIPGLNGQKPMDQVSAELGRAMLIQAKAQPAERAIAPAIAIGYRSDPVAAVRLLNPETRIRTVTMANGVPVAFVPRAYAGQNMGYIDAWVYAAVAEISDSSGVGLRSVA